MDDTILSRSPLNRGKITTDNLDLHGSEAVLLMEHEVEGLTVSDLPLTLDFEVPLFGSHYESVIVVVTMTRADYAEGNTQASTVAYDYVCWAERGEHAAIVGSKVWPPTTAAISSCQECVMVDGSIVIGSGASLVIEEGAKLYFSDTDLTPYGGQVELRVEPGGSCVIGDYYSPYDIVTLESAGGDGFSWDGIVSTGNSDLSLYYADLSQAKLLAAGEVGGVGPQVAIKHSSISFAPNAFGFLCNGTSSMDLYDVDLSNTTNIWLGDGTVLRLVEAEVADSHTGPAIRVMGDCAIYDSHIVNALSGVEVVDYANASLGIEQTWESLRISGRHRFNTGSAGVMAREHSVVTMDNVVVEGFEKGLLAEDWSNTTVRSSEVFDVVDGVYVSISGASVDIGDLSGGGGGENCISSDLSSGGVRVYSRTRGIVTWTSPTLVDA
jgi:hypothetical protein